MVTATILRIRTAVILLATLMSPGGRGHVGGEACTNVQLTSQNDRKFSWRHGCRSLSEWNIPLKLAFPRWRWAGFNYLDATPIPQHSREKGYKRFNMANCLESASCSDDTEQQRPVEGDKLNTAISIPDRSPEGELIVWKPGRHEWLILGCLTIVTLMVVSCNHITASINETCSRQIQAIDATILVPVLPVSSILQYQQPTTL
jgi:hypothetical protein